MESAVLFEVLLGAPLSFVCIFNLYNLIVNDLLQAKSDAQSSWNLWQIFDL